MGGFRMEKNDLKILCRLRKNSRENLTRMSRITKIPVSTLHDKLKRFKGNIIAKNTTIVNFKEIGYDIKVNILFKVESISREDFKRFLYSNKNINSLYRINNGYDFMVEALFKDMREFKDFIDKIDEFGASNVQEFFILEDLKREDFMTQETPNFSV